MPTLSAATSELQTSERSAATTFMVEPSEYSPSLSESLSVSRRIFLMSSSVKPSASVKLSEVSPALLAAFVVDQGLNASTGAIAIDRVPVARGAGEFPR